MKILSKVKALLNYPYSYAYPILKMAICVLYIIFCFFVGEFSLFFRVIFAVCLFQVLYYLAGSIEDVIDVSENREKKTIKQEWIVRCGLKKIETILTENDIIELSVKTNNKVIRIGSSSYLDTYNNLTGKKYYINDSEYDTIDEFTEELKKIYPGGRVTICSIDGISPKKTKYFQEE